MMGKFLGLMGFGVPPKDLAIPAAQFSVKGLGDVAVIEFTR